MDNFDEELQRIKELDRSEGPRSNVFEPRFEARTACDNLRQALTQRLLNVDADNFALQRQLCRVYLFLGVNHYETEEIREGEKLLCTAYALARNCVVHKSTTSPDQNPTVREVLSDDVDFRGASLTNRSVWMEALNAIGVFLSSRSEVPEAVQDARRVLHKAEHVYTSTTDRDAEMERLMTQTVFYLAQAYGALGDARTASRYVHETMVRQMRSKVEFSTKDWATNAIHLAGFYAGESRFSCAFHCLAAARMVMPTEPADEETLGVVAWGFGKVWKAVLREATHSSSDEPPLTWWQDLPVPGLQSPGDCPIPRTFHDARAVFRNAVLELKEAAKYYTFDTCCPDYVGIHQDIAECYKLLAEFEPDVERRAAMLLRRIEAIEQFPLQLSFNAYATLIRQLYFDLGESATDLFDLRAKQKHDNAGKPLTNRQLNFLCKKALGFFNAFLATFNDANGSRPAKVDKELRVAVFRASMRVARLEGKRIGKSPEEEYAIIGVAIAAYDEVLKFVENNDLASNPEVQVEVNLAREMKALLPNKQRDLRRAFSKA
jgi:hypothetical protein